MKITVIAVGKLKEKYWSMAENEYCKRLQAYSKINILEIAEEKATDKLSVEGEKIIKQKEGQRIFSKIEEKDFVIVLSIQGKKYDSEALSTFLQNQMNTGNGHFVFIIGGSLGLCPNVIARANAQLSFSDMTFPHQMMRIILLEQIYRSFKIMKGEPYHK